MSEMIDRCVAALADMPIPCNRFNLREMLIACMVVVDGPVAVPLAPKGVDLWLREIIRTVIDTMREPTGAMLNCAWDTSDYDTGLNPDEIWAAMIDAALTPR